MTRRRRILLALLALPLLAVLYLAVQLARGPAETIRRQETFEHPVARAPLPSPGSPPGPAPAAPSGSQPDPVGGTVAEQRVVAVSSPQARPLEVLIDLSDGQFRIEPGEPGSPIVIDAEYDAGNFSLRHEYVGGPEEGGRFEVDFRRETSRARGLFRAVTWAPWNEVEVRLPPDVPLDVTMRLNNGQRDVDLTGLAITRLRLELNQGQTNLRFAAPNPLVMDLLDIRMSKGQLTADGLGHAQAREVELRGSMGQMELDFHGEARGETRARIRMTMGQVDLRLARDRPLAVENARAFLGEVETPRSPAASGSNTLTLDLSASFGAIETR